MQHTQILEQFWQHICEPAKADQSGQSDHAKQWNLQVKTLYAHQIAYPVALRYLLGQRPSLPEFLTWVAQSEVDYQLAETSGNMNEGNKDDWVLTPEQIAFWNTHGYLVLPSVFDRQICAETCQAICEFLGVQQDDPSSWQLANQKKLGLMMPFYNHPRLNANRESGRIRAAYRQLYGTDALYKTIDHASFNPPLSSENPFSGSGLHWDVSLAQPMPDKFQGLLYLTDCGPRDGAFHCVPGFHCQLADWLQQLPAGANPRETAEKTLVPKAVPGNAGDFVIWHQALPHCATPNYGNKPRIVQYLTYIPDEHSDHEVWI